MNTWTAEMRRSLKELDLGLKGELTMGPDMEELSNALFFDQVPASWTKRAYDSLNGLSAWYADMLLRLKELIERHRRARGVIVVVIVGGADAVAEDPAEPPDHHQPLPIEVPRSAGAAPRAPQGHEDPRGHGAHRHERPCVHRGVGPLRAIRQTARCRVSGRPAHSGPEAHGGDWRARRQGGKQG